MSRFNTPSAGTKTVNLAGGQAFTQTPELELVSILLTSFAKDQFYRSADDTFERIKQLIVLCDKKFIAQAAIYARTKFGMRSITHVVASELAKYIGGQPWAQNFYQAIVYRPDDMLEILSYHKAKNGKYSNAMKKGFAKAFNKFGEYELAKYRGENKGVKLVDTVNVVHPKSTEKNKKALNDLMNGTLKSIDTWESKLTQAGQKAENNDEKLELKKDAWTGLIQERKLGYFALLKNLRNIIEQAPDALQGALEMLVDPNLIRKSLVLPFRFITANEEIQKMASSAAVRNTMIYLNKALDISISNVPGFEGETLVVLDESQSMKQNKVDTIGALFAAVLVKKNNCDLITFGGSARYRNMNVLDSITTMTKDLTFNMGNTDFHCIFQAANKLYNRIIILSDMQGWVGHHAPTAAYNQYKLRTNAKPFIYSIDLAGYGSMQFPEPQVFCLAGFSEKVFDFMKMIEQDKNAMVNEIKKIEF